MTNEYLANDPPWDDEEKAVEGGGKTHFAKARLYYPLYIDRFQAGQHFTLPGLFYDEYDEASKASSRVGPKEFRGMALAKGGQFYLALVALEMRNKDGQWYQRQIQFGNWKDKDDTGCAWLDLQKDEMLKLSPADRNALTQAAKDNKWAFIRYTEGETGYTGQYEIKKYLTNITVFKNEKAWLEEEAAFRAQFSENDVSGNDVIGYPADWGTNPTQIEKMLAHGKTLEHENHRHLAKQLFLIDKDTDVFAKTANGETVNVEAILADILNIPPPMVKLTEDDKPY